METVAVKTIESTGMAMRPMMDAQISAISSRYAQRGLVRAVESAVREQEEAERKTFEQAPHAYRISSLSDAAVAGLYRRGKKQMSGSDLIRYFTQTRQTRIANCDFAEEKSVYELADPTVDTKIGEETAVAKASETAVATSTAPRGIRSTVSKYAKRWFCFHDDETQKTGRKFPLSALAAMIAIAVSLMLIVASAVMLTRAETRINTLTLEAESIADDISELQSDIEVENQMLYLREIAMEYYGMVDEKYVQTTYLDNEKEETIESFEEERQGGVGLAALLSAMGVGD